MGKLIYTNSGNVLENVMYECTRRIITDNNEYKCEYILDTHGEVITISQAKNSIIYNVKLSNNWTDDNETVLIRSDKWIKDKVLTHNDLIKILESYKNDVKN